MKRMNGSCKIFLYFVAVLGGLFSGTAGAAIAINDSYSFSTADSVPFQVFVVDNDDVDIDFNKVTLTLGQLFTDNATFKVALQEGNPYFEVTPDASFTTGTIEFNYTVTDPDGSSDAFVSIEVTNTGLDKLVDDTYFANVDVLVTLNVLDNDTITAVEFDTTADISGLTGGNLLKTGVGIYTFRATAAGKSVFTYTVDGISGQKGTVTVFVDSASIPRSTISATTSGGSIISEGATTQITLARSGSAQEAISIQVALKSGSTADASDFTLLPSTVSWSAGDTASKTVTVSVNKDTAIEATESLVFEFINPTGGAEYIGADIALTINATDSVNFVSANYGVLEDAGSVSIEVARSGTGSGAASIKLFLDAGSTATAGSDFTFTDATTVSWIDGETGNKTVTIPIIFDADALEGTENIVLNLASNANLFPGSVFSTSIAITNVVSLDEINFVAPTYSVLEDGGTVVVQVTRTGNGIGAAAVDVELAAAETATQGTDFTFAATATVNWLDGETGTKDIVIPIASDVSVEGDETFSLSLGTSPTNANLGVNTATQVTITDVVPIDDVIFVSTIYSVAENAGSVTVQVHRVGSGIGAAAVDVELAAAETATQGT
ncbi:MAG: hypothetical protein JKY93_13105, partial [Gammaproteobacteria bacterium]|nr:hypothetical protein [Gammaproteobacteria bacterium]